MFPYTKDPQGPKDMGAAVPGIRSQSGDCTDGFGKMQFAEGNVYEGNWQDDEMEGIGTYTFASDGASWEGPPKRRKLSTGEQRPQTWPRYRDLSAVAPSYECPRVRSARTR